MDKALLAAALGLVLAGCSSGSKDGSKQDHVGAQATDLAADTNVLRDANAASSDVVRSAGDCEAVKAALPEANRKLDELERRVRTSTGQASLRALRKQVNDVAGMCP
jgi:outer membrane murein-binding lipoprotein Lpp